MKISALAIAVRVIQANSRASISVSNLAVKFRGLVIVQIHFSKMQPSPEWGLIDGGSIGDVDSFVLIYFNYAGVAYARWSGSPRCCER
jgi:hypothetical protein